MCNECLRNYHKYIRNFSRVKAHLETKGVTQPQSFEEWRNEQIAEEMINCEDILVLTGPEGTEQLVSWKNLKREITWKEIDQKTVEIYYPIENEVSYNNISVCTIDSVFLMDSKCVLHSSIVVVDNIRISTLTIRLPEDFTEENEKIPPHNSKAIVFNYLSRYSKLEGSYEKEKSIVLNLEPIKPIRLKEQTSLEFKKSALTIYRPELDTDNLTEEKITELVHDMFKELLEDETIIPPQTYMLKSSFSPFQCLDEHLINEKEEKTTGE